jgi:predicted type IV restriction endonuclease
MRLGEAFSRVLVDKALEASGWNLLDPRQVVYEFHTPSGRADYLLKDNVGRVLCVLEAKREDLDPYDAKEQASGYARNLSAPFVILTNGRENWFWNYERAEHQDAYISHRAPSIPCRPRTNPAKKSSTSASTGNRSDPARISSFD